MTMCLAEILGIRRCLRRLPVCCCAVPPPTESNSECLMGKSVDGALIFYGSLHFLTQLDIPCRHAWDHGYH